MLKKTCHLHPHDWAQALLGATWAYRTAFKATTQHTPFHLAYGLEAVAPFEFTAGSPRVAAFRLDSASALQHSHASRLLALEEARSLASKALHAEQNRRKAWHDRHLRHPQFRQGDLVLLYQARFLKKARKLIPAWEGPYRVMEILPRGAVQLATLDNHLLPLVNGSRLRLYHM